MVEQEPFKFCVVGSIPTGLTRDDKIRHASNPAFEISDSIFSARHVFSKDPNKTSTLAERGANTFYAEGFTDGDAVMGNANDPDPEHIKEAHVAHIQDIIVSDDPRSAIPFLWVSWISKETEDLTLLHRLFTKVRSK